MSYKCKDSPALLAALRCIVGWDNGSGTTPVYCDCPVVEADAKSPHKASDDEAMRRQRREALAELAASDAELLDDGDIEDEVIAGMRAAHIKSDDTAIIAAEKRKLDGQRTAIRRSLEQALERPTNAALKRHIDGLRGYQESVVMELIDRAGSLG